MYRLGQKKGTVLLSTSLAWLAAVRQKLSLNLTPFLLLNPVLLILWAARQGGTKSTQSTNSQPLSWHPKLREPNPSYKIALWFIWPKTLASQKWGEKKIQWIEIPSSSSQSNCNFKFLFKSNFPILLVYALWSFSRVFPTASTRHRKGEDATYFISKGIRRMTALNPSKIRQKIMHAVVRYGMGQAATGRLNIS